MKRSASSRKPAKVSDPLHHQLNMYALAATAAGVSTLALTPSAEAKIVYTSTNQTIRFRQPAEIDLNHDGIQDFAISAYSVHTNTVSSQSQYKDWLNVSPDQASNTVVENASSFAAALPPGKPIGPRRKVGTRLITMAFCRFARTTQGKTFASSKGPWRKEHTAAYLGLKFTVKGKIHYGWARLVESNCGGSILTGYAYETIPNKAIVAGRKKGAEEAGTHVLGQGASLASPIPAAPERAMLGALAAGAPALSIWRRKERIS